MTTYFAIVFELKSENPLHKKKLQLLLEKNFNNFIRGIRQSEELKIYMKQGSKLVVE